MGHPEGIRTMKIIVGQTGTLIFWALEALEENE